MSIASEITALNTNLTAAKNAVTAKGGTVGNTGLAGLANEIAGIPSGGGGGATSWGKIYFYSFNIGWEWEFIDPVDCSITVEDEAVWKDFVAYQLGWEADEAFMNPEIDSTINLGMIECSTGDSGETWEITFMTYDGQTYSAYYYSYDPDTFTMETGLSFTPEPEVDYASVNDIQGTYSSSTDTTKEYAIELANEDDLSSLNNSEGLGYVSVAGVNIPVGAIFKYEFGEDVQTTPELFLGGLTSLTEIDFSHATSLTSIGNNFLSSCASFNQPIAIPDTVTTIGNNFLSFSPFNQSLDLPNVTSIGNDFLRNCISFNQPLDLSSITTIGNGFLWYCTSFNQSLDLPNVTSIGNDFLWNCISFNQSLDLPNVTSIGSGLLNGCISFNQNLTIPGTVTSIGIGFLLSCNSMTSTVYCNAPANVASTSSTTLATRTSSAPCYTTGITLAGTYASDWKTRFPDSSNSPYRKLILGS